MNSLAGKVAIVTGASKGIGAGIAKAFCAEGAAVVVNYASNKQAAAWGPRREAVSRLARGGGLADSFISFANVQLGETKAIELPRGSANVATEAVTGP